MVLPPGLQAFSTAPIWHVLFLLLAVGIAGYCGRSWRRSGARQDLFYMLMGGYLTVVQLPVVFPPLGKLLGFGQPVLGSSMGFILAAPAVVLLVLGVRAR